MKTNKKPNAFTNILNNNSLVNIEDLKQKVIDPIINEGEVGEEPEANSNPITKPVVEKKLKTDKNLEFIQSLLVKVDKSEGKGFLYASKKTHSRLKVLSYLADVNIIDLTESILNDFFEKNKEKIEILKKKSEF